MRTSLLAIAMVLGIHQTALGGECTPAVQVRWEDAMREAMQVYRAHMGRREYTLAENCRTFKAMTELSAAAKQYFPTCDPITDGRASVLVKEMDAATAGVDASACQRLKAQAPAGKK